MNEFEAQVQIKSIPDKIWMQISKDDKEAIKMAYMALEKQIPKKTILQRSDEKSLYKCPCCDSIFVEAYDNMQRGYIPKFCEMCGQSISFRLE